MTEAVEPPFVPRERLLKYQQIFQNTHKHTYLKGRFDKITSVAIPLALAGTSLFLIVGILLIAHCLAYRTDFTGAQNNVSSFVNEQGRGIYNMSHGIGKKE